MVELLSSDERDLCKQNFHAAVGVGKEPVVQQWNPRSKAGAAVWKADIDDLLVWHGLRETAVDGPPTMEEISIRFPDASLAQMQDFLHECEQHYAKLNREVYFLIKPTLIFEGEFADIDAATVQRRFGTGDNRDGHGLLMWAHECSANSVKAPLLGLLLYNMDKGSKPGVKVLPTSPHSYLLISQSSLMVPGARLNSRGGCQSPPKGVSIYGISRLHLWLRVHCTCTFLRTLCANRSYVCAEL